MTFPYYSGRAQKLVLNSIYGRRQTPPPWAYRRSDAYREYYGLPEFSQFYPFEIIPSLPATYLQLQGVTMASKIIYTCDEPSCRQTIGDREKRVEITFIIYTKQDNARGWPTKSENLVAHLDGCSALLTAQKLAEGTGPTVERMELSVRRWDR